MENDLSTKDLLGSREMSGTFIGVIMRGFVLQQVFRIVGTDLFKRVRKTERVEYIIIRNVQLAVSKYAVPTQE